MANRLRFWKIILMIILIQWIPGCSMIDQKALVRTNKGPQKIAIFFDGTDNDEQSDTNVKKLHSLVTLQNRDDISALYIEGVGAGDKIIGMATGWGIQHRVKMAYTFLIEHYRQDDEIFIFGFSRGAYSARILASLLYHAGIPNLDSSKSFSSAADISDIVYDAVKDDGISSERRRDNVIDKHISISSPVPVRVLGLWDTVEALGIQNSGAKLLDKLGFDTYVANIDNPNERYGDQLCNVKQAFHAVSIDDDREWIFTPALLTRKHLLETCSLALGKPLIKNINEVDEVWFSGAHSDVGGGYNDSLLSGVSLNWMIKKLKDTKLLPKDASVPEDPFGSSHNPESGYWSPIYHEQSRHILKYATSENYNNMKIKLHSSVIERLKKIKPKVHEFNWMNKGTDKDGDMDMNEYAYPECFDNGLNFKDKECNKIDIVYD